MIFPVLFFKSFFQDILEMHIYLVIFLIKTIFNAVYGIMKGFKIRLTIIFFLDDHGKNCLLNFGNDKNQRTFFFVPDSGPLRLALFFIH